MFKQLVLTITASFLLIGGASAQTSADGSEAIKSATMAQVHELAESMVKQVNASAPINVDAITSVTGATYTRSNNTFLYRVKLATNIRSDEFFQTQQKRLCAGKIVVAMMERTVQFVYSVTTPQYGYTVAYNYFHC